MALNNQIISSLAANLVANAAGGITGANIANVTSNLQTFISNNGTTVKSVSIQSSTDSAFTSNYTLTLPVNDGSSGQYLQTDGSGILSWTDTGTPSNIANGNSNVNIPTANGNVNISAVGNANILVVTGTGANITGTANVSGNANVGNLGTNTAIITAGNITNANITTANITTANVSTAIITTGNITTVNTGLVQNGNSNVAITANANITLTAKSNATMVISDTGANITGTANVSGNANVGNLGTDTAVITTGNITTVNTGLVQNGNSNVAITANANITLTAKSNATMVISDTGANITGTANVSGNANVGNLNTGELTATSNVNFTSSPNVSLGAVGNVKITGGSASQYLQTDGSGNLSWQTVSTTSTSISNGNSNVSIPTANGNVNIVAVGNTTLVVTGTGANISGTLNANGNANLGNLSTANIVATVINTGLMENGNSNVTIAANANVSISANGASNVIVVSATSANITGNANISGFANITGNANIGGNLGTAGLTATGTVNFTTSANVSLGSNSNVKITGGSLNQYLQTDGAGNLSWSSVSASLSNGNSNVNIPAANGNVNIVAVGNTTLVVTGTGANIAGTANVTGNVIGGNIVTTGQITSNRAGNLSNGGGQLFLNGSGNNRIDFNQNGVAAPTSGTRSAGTKITLYPSVGSGSNADYAIGVDGSTVWTSLPLSNSTAYFKWYGGTTEVANLSAIGDFTGANIKSNAGFIAVANNGTSLQQVTIKASTSASFTGNYTLTLPVDDGNSGQVLTTDGSGVLSWANAGGTNISNGNSNVSIPAANGNVNITAAGVTTLVVTGTGANIAGTANITGVANIGGVLNIAGGGGTANLGLVQRGNSNISFVNNGNITITARSNATLVISNIGVNIAGDIQSTGNLQLDGNATVANIDGNIGTFNTINIGIIQNGTSNLSIPTANGLISFSSNSKAGVVTISTDNVGNLTTITGGQYSTVGTTTVSDDSVNTNTIAQDWSGAISGGSLYAYYQDPPYNGNGYALTYYDTTVPSAKYIAGNLTAIGPYNMGTGNWTLEGWYYLTTAAVNSSGNAKPWQTSANLSNVNSSVTSLRLWDSTGFRANQPGYVLGSEPYSCLNTNTVGVSEWFHVAWVRSGTTFTMYLNGNVATVANSTGGDSRTSTTLAGTEVFNFSSNPQIIAVGEFSSIYKIRLSNTALYTANFTPSTIYGNTANTVFLLKAVDLPPYFSGNIRTGNIITTNLANFQGNVLMTGPSINLGFSSNIAILGGNNGQVLSTDGNGFLTWQAALANGNSNVNIPNANGNVNISAVGNANVLVVTGTGANITGTANVSGNANVGNLGTGALTATSNVTFTSSPNVSLGAVGNVKITGGSSGQYLQTDGSGNLSWQTVSGGGGGASISNGNSNVNIAAANGNVTISAVGNANVLVVTGTGANITGTANITGDLITGGNLTVNGTGITSIAGNIDMNGKWVGNIGYAVLDTDAASKLYVDTLVTTGISYHAPVNAATTTTLATATGGTTAYNQPNGAGNGIGAYISTTGSFTTIDGVTINGSTSVRILVKDEANGSWNGVYTYTNATAITRSTDADQYGVGNISRLAINDYFFTQAGTVNNGTAFIVSAPAGTITFGTSSIQFSIFSTSAVYTGGTGITVSGTVISANASQTQITAVGTLGSLSVTGNTTSGNFIGVFANGNSNVSIPSANGNVNISSAGNANVLVITGTGANITGTLNVSANANVGNLGTDTAIITSGNITNANITTANITTGNFTTGNITTINSGLLQNGNSNIAITANANITLTANSNAVVAITSSGDGNLQTTGVNVSGYINASGNIIGANLVGPLANGNSNIAITSNANITLTAKSNSTMVISDTGANITGTLNVSANANLGNLGTDTAIITTGNITNANITTANITTANVTTAIISTGNITTINTGLLQNGNSNVAITANANITLTAKSNATMVITDTGANVTGTANISGNANVGNLGTAALTATSNVDFTSSPNVSLGAVGNVKITGGTADYVLQTDGAGNLSWVAQTGGGGGGASISNGTSNVNIPSVNGNVNISSAGNANILVVTGTGANVTGTFRATGNINAPNVIGGNLLTSGFASVTGNIDAGANINLDVGATRGILNGNTSISFAPNANITLTATSNNTMVITATGANITGTGNFSGNLSAANLIGSLANGNSNVNIPSANGNVNISAEGNANILVVTGTGANITGTGNFSGNLSAANLIGTLANGNSNIAITANANITLTAKSNATMLITDTGANITGYGNITGNANVGGIANIVGNIIGQTKLFVGTGGSSLTNPVAVFQGSGATFTQLALYNSIDTGSADIVTYGNNGDDTNSWADMGFTGNNFNDANYTVTAPGDGYLFVQGNSSFGGNLVIATGNLGTTKDIVFATGGFLTGNIKARLFNANGLFDVTANISANNFLGNLIGSLANGTSNVSIPAASGNVNITAAGNTTLVITGTGANISGTANVSGNLSAGNISTTALTASGNINFTSSPNVFLGPVGNVEITGGSSGQYLQTDGTGNLSWQTVTGGSSSNISNGTSNVDIAASGGNVTVGVGGTAAVATFTTTGANISGTANVTGSIIGGNIVTTGQITSTRAGNQSTGGGQLFINGSNGRIDFSQSTLALPSFTNRSGGQKITLYPSLTGTEVDYAIGVAASTFWQSIDQASSSFDWFAGTTEIANLTGTGAFQTAGNITAPNFIGVFANGNSNISIPAANGNINMSVGGNANRFVIDSAGNTTVGNLFVTRTVDGVNGITLSSGNTNIRFNVNNAINFQTIGSNVLQLTNTYIAPNANTIPASSNNFTLGNSANFFSSAFISNLSSSFIDGTNPVGFMNVPIISVAANANTVLADAGKAFYHASGVALNTITIAANANVNYINGTVLTFINLSANALSIACGDTMTFIGNGATGTRTLANNGMATAIKVANTAWVISGSNIT